MKTCTKCGHSKLESEYFVRYKLTGKLHAQCKICYAEHRRSYYTEHYKKYGDAYRARAKIRRARIKQALQINMLAYLQGKVCAVCNESDLRVLEFDHIDPSKKEFGISHGISYGFEWEAILVEIKKCRILCANCHRRHTTIQGGWYRNTK